MRTRPREKNCRGPSPGERGTSVSFISKGSQVPTVKNRETSPCFWQGEGKGTILKVLNKSCPGGNQLSRA